MAIGVQVSGNYRQRAHIRRDVYGRKERAVSSIDQETDSSTTRAHQRIRYSNVGLAITVEVRHCRTHWERSRTHRIRDSRSKSTVAISEQHSYIVTALIRND